MMDTPAAWCDDDDIPVALDTQNTSNVVETVQRHSSSGELDSAAQNLRNLLEDIDPDAIKDPGTLHSLTNQISDFIEKYVSQTSDATPTTSSTDVLANHLSGLLSMLESSGASPSLGPLSPGQSLIGRGSPLQMTSPHRTRTSLRALTSPSASTPPKHTRATTLQASAVEKTLDVKRRRAQVEQESSTTKTLSAEAEQELLTRLSRWQAHHEAKLTAGKVKVEEELASKIKSKPSIDARSRKLARAVKPIHERQTELIAARERRLEVRRQEREAQELEGVRGPQLSQKSRAMVSKATDMSKWEEQRQKKLRAMREKAREEQDAIDYRPQISDRSRRLANKRGNAMERLTRAPSRPVIAPEEEHRPAINESARKMKSREPAWRRLYESRRRPETAGAGSPQVVAGLDEEEAVTVLDEYDDDVAELMSMM